MLISIVDKIKYMFTKCLCISIRTKSSYASDKKDLSFKVKSNKLGIIYEDIEYKSVKDLSNLIP